MDAPRVLVVDDEPLIRLSVAAALRSAGYTVREAASAERALGEMESAGGVDVVLVDQRLPDMDGLALLEQIKSHHPDTVVILMTAYASVDSAVQAMRDGAYHYAAKPLNLDETLHFVENAMEATRLRRELKALRAVQSTPYGLDAMVGESPEIRRAKAMIEKYAAIGSTVLITGESGTGKDLAAKIIHYNGARVANRFMNITCTALPETLLESELFGHEKGAFTDAWTQRKGLLELAQGGTVFLDEIGDMPPNLQAKLLRFLEERAFRRVGGSTDIQVDVRVIATSNRDLGDAVRHGRFRQDLYYRLAILELRLPALRERHGDVPLLAKYFMHTLGRELQKAVRSVTDGAWRALGSHAWPGNVRQLRNVIERALLLLAGDVLRAPDLHFGGDGAQPHTFQLPAEGIDFHALERSLFVQAFERARGNQTQAARLLGLHRDQIRYRMRKYGLSKGTKKQTERRK